MPTMENSVPPSESDPSSAFTSSSSLKKDKASTAGLPAWVQAAMEQETLAQPWKQYAGAENDDPNFAQSRDTVTFYDDKIKVCYGEGSMAA